MENTETEHPEDPEYLCKHCEAGGTACPDCDGDVYSRKPSLGDEPCELCKGEGVLIVEDAPPNGIVLADDVTSVVSPDAQRQWYQETISARGIVLLTEVKPEPEPTPEPQEDKPQRWRFTVGYSPFESHSRQAKDALGVLYAIGLGRCGLSRELWEKRERVRELLDQLAQEMVGEVPSIEELC